ncbi:GNAT family N-acetyltransferase [Lujinxingia litoralis]|uniref:GNAT family N-acetyltransferase n=1 Tax=Lujinxingia litoralis TaxID=2211119 RepID=A0A328CBE8_9DELT|nr:GNAT family N-acetyltransferase [Lujinxingia litoralis]RAL25358.1 GNAT family N-acetyltransferase [Lujinxingia litoralis]
MSPTPPEFSHERHGPRGVIFLERRGQRLARVEYIHRAGEARLRITHTEVDQSLRGQGMARKLLEALGALAREQGLTLVPVCPAARAILRKTPELHDVLDASFLPDAEP